MDLSNIAPKVHNQVPHGVDEIVIEADDEFSPERARDGELKIDKK